jgi:anti-sigma-K factor RskA
MTAADKRDDASLTGSYALNALSPEEREEFERNLVISEALRHEVTEFADTAVVLGLAVDPVAPPAALKTSIMDRIASMPQLAPVSSAPTPDPVEEQLPETDVAASDIEARFSPAATKAQQRWFAKPVVMLASAAAVIGLIAGGGVLATSLGTSQTQQQQASALAEITKAPDAQQAVSDIAGGGSATLVWSEELLSSAIMVDGLATLPSDKVYELWYIDGSGTARPAGTFSVDDSGETWRVLDGDMAAGDTVGVTVEPAGGSDAPTTTPILAIASA